MDNPTKVNKINIALTDDHELFRIHLSNALKTNSNFNVVFEASNGTDLLQYLLANQTPDVILLDITMPGISGLQLLPILLAENPDLKIIMLSMHAQAAIVNEALKMGATSYLKKDVEIDDLFNAINSVAAISKNPLGQAGT